jgi:hypothetical protein
MLRKLGRKERISLAFSLRSEQEMQRVVAFF